MIRPKRYGSTLDLEYRKGHCCFCDAKLRGRQVLRCGAKECAATYHRCYRDRQRQLRRLGLVRPYLLRTQRLLRQLREVRL